MYIIVAIIIFTELRAYGECLCMVVSILPQGEDDVVLIDVESYPPMECPHLPSLHQQEPAAAQTRAHPAQLAHASWSHSWRNGRKGCGQPDTSNSEELQSKSSLIPRLPSLTLHAYRKQLNPLPTLKNIQKEAEAMY